MNIVTWETWEKLRNFDSRTFEVKKIRSYAYLIKNYAIKKNRGVEV